MGFLVKVSQRYVYQVSGKIRVFFFFFFCYCCCCCCFCFVFVFNLISFIYLFFLNFVFRKLSSDFKAQ